MISISAARAEDVPAMSAVLIASISELCAPDHRNDPESVAGWIRNKSVAGVRDMLADADNFLFVAEFEGTLAAVGCVRGGSQVALNYVHPGFRFRAVSTMLLAAMEQAIRAAGHTEATLTSTATARRFYLARGWQETGPGAPRAGYPMRKAL